MPKGVYESPIRGRYERTPEIRRATGDRKRTHGMSHTPTYSAWSLIIKICSNPNRDGYSKHGGRGIKVCERWKDFRNFFADMGERPEGMYLRRIDSSGDFEPGNCQWGPREKPKGRDIERQKRSVRERHARLAKEDPEYSRWMHIKQRYGLDREAFKAIVAAQLGCCYLCGDSLELDKPRRIHIDHDHSCCPGDKSCGECVRGISCEQCNKGIGCFRDDTERMRRVVENLEAANRRLAVARSAPAA